MKRLFFAIVFTTLLNASETPKENQPDKSSVPAQELTPEEKATLNQAVNLEICLMVAQIMKDPKLSTEDTRKAQNFFEQCSNNKYFHGYALSKKFEELNHASEQSKRDAIYNFVIQSKPENAEIIRLLNHFILSSFDKLLH